MEKLNKNLGGIKEMEKLPSLIFLVDSKKELICTKEARKLGIPTIGLIAHMDTSEDANGNNIKPNIIKKHQLMHMYIFFKRKIIYSQPLNII